MDWVSIALAYAILITWIIQCVEQASCFLPISNHFSACTKCQTLWTGCYFCQSRGAETAAPIARFDRSFFIQSRSKRQSCCFEDYLTLHTLCRNSTGYGSTTCHWTQLAVFEPCKGNHELDFCSHREKKLIFQYFS